jgi:LysM repeat protein
VKNVPSSCDLCFVKALKFQAESPYYYDPVLASIYTSKTSSCGISGMPLTTTTAIPGVTITADPPGPTPTSCRGESYMVKPGDTCESVAKSQHIGTGWLITDNNLTSSCADFPKSGSICLINTCKTVTVQKNDTCEAIVRANNVSIPQLKAWNLVRRITSVAIEC